MGAANTCCASPMNQNPELQKLVIDHERNLALLKLQLEEEKLSHEATERKIHSLKKLQQNTYGSLTEEIQINENLEEQLKEIQVNLIMMSIYIGISYTKMHSINVCCALYNKKHQKYIRKRKQQMI